MSHPLALEPFAFGGDTVSTVLKDELTFEWDLPGLQRERERALCPLEARPLLHIHREPLTCRPAPGLGSPVTLPTSPSTLGTRPTTLRPVEPPLSPIQLDPPVAPRRPPNLT